MIELNYKNYKICQSIVCYSIKYLVIGDGLYCEYYDSIDDAKKAIDTYICKSYLINMLSSISKNLDVDKSIVINSFKDILLLGEI